MVKSRRNASSSGVPKVLSRWIRRSPSGVVGSGAGHAVLHDLLARLDLAAERRDLDHFLRAEADVREAEAAADDPAVPE